MFIQLMHTIHMYDVRTFFQENLFPDFHRKLILNLIK